MQADSIVTCDACGTNDFLTDGDSPDDWHCAEERDLCPACVDSIRRGVTDFKAGRVTPWEEVENLLPT